MTHTGQLTVVVDKHNNKAINVLFAHKYRDGKLIHTMCGFLILVTHVLVNEIGNLFHSDTSLVVALSTLIAQHESLS